MLCEVTNNPMVTLPVMVTLVEPICVHVFPLVDSHEVKVLPDLCSLSHLLGELKPERFVAVFEPLKLYCMRTPLPKVGVIGGRGLPQPLRLHPTPLIFGVL